MKAPEIDDFRGFVEILLTKTGRRLAPYLLLDETRCH